MMFEELNQNLILVSSKFIKQKEYWKRKLSGDISETAPAFGAHRYKLEDQKGFETIGFVFPGDLSGKLMRLSNQNDLALYITLLAALKSIIFRFTSKRNIMVLSPVYKPNETEETINDLLLIYDILHHDISLKELLLNIRRSVLEAYENQDYPFEILMESLFDTSSQQDNAFSDILCSLENIHNDVNIEERNLGLLFSFLRQGDEIKGKIRYDIGIYDGNFLEKVPAYLVNLFNEFFQNTSIKILEISFLSESKKKQLLNDFNDSRLEYPGEKSINELFAEQVQKTADRIAVVGSLAGPGYDSASGPGGGQRFIACLTYKELKQKAEQVAHRLKLKGIKSDSIVAIQVERSLEMLTCILGILNAGGAYLPIAPAYPEERIKYILRDSKPGMLITTGAQPAGKEMQEVLDLLDTDIYRVKTGCMENTSTPNNLVYVIYTSGSTGKPKGVMVEHRQVINLVYGLGEVIYKKYGPHLKVALIAPYEFDASAQQIYASLLLGHCLYIVPDETKVDGMKLLKYFKKHTINISDGTPTHLRLIVQSISGNTMGLAMKHFLIAGEELPKSVVEELLNGFEDGPPGISNIYGPTETCVDSTFFHIAAQKLDAFETVPIGKALPNEQVYILNKGCKLQPIGVPGELCITGDGVSRGYLNQPALTGEKFAPHPFSDRTTMYRTGDLARWLPDGNIEFLGRIDRQVKIRGFRIETGEIENQLRKKEEIKEAVVLPKGEKKEDLYLCAYIVSGNHLETAGLRKWLSDYLPDYMIPSYFVKLDRLPLTPNGKIDIKALPEPELKSGQAYAPPRNEIEQKLTGIWSEVLSGDVLNVAPGERPVIGIDDNFFELGGHSLKATTLVYKIYKELNVDIKIIDVFTNPTIRELAQRLKASRQLEYIGISPTEEKEYYDLSYAQRRLWILCQFEEDSTAYNIPSANIISGSFHVDSFINAIQTMARRHESLRTVFITLNGEPKQKIIKNFVFHLEQIDLRAEDGNKEEKSRQVYREFANRAFDLEQGPLFEYKVLRLDNQKYLLMSNFHHVINDGWSLGIIRGELITLYNAFLTHRKNPLSPLKLQYRDYTRWHNQLIEAGRFYKSRQYWLEKFKDKPNGIDLPLDHPRKPIQTFNGARIHFSLDKKKLFPLCRLNSNEEATLFMVLLTLWSIFLYKYSGQNDIIIGFPIAGRKHTELNHMIGFLVNTLVFRNKIDPSESFVNLLEKLRAETLTCYDYQDYPFDLLVEELSLERDLSQFPLFNVMMAYSNANTRDIEWEAKGLNFSNYLYTDDFNMSKFDLIFFINENRDKLYMMLEYNSDLFERESIERMRENFLYLLDQVINNAAPPIFSYNPLAPGEYVKVTKGFNDTGCSFPALSLQQLFENQVKKSREKTAVVHKNDKISYEELNKKINQMAHYLREEYNIKPNDIIAVSVDRSIDMIMVLWGIIKSGAGYLALDPTYPRDRVLYVLENSRAHRLIIDKMRPEFFANYEGEILDIDTHRDKISRKSPANPVLVNKSSDILYVNYTSGSTGVPNGAMLSHDLLTNLIQWQIEKSSINCSLRCLQFTSINFCVSFQEIMGTLTAGGELYLIDEIERQDIDYLMDFLTGHQIQVLFLPFSYLNFLFNESSRWNRSFNHCLNHIITAGEQLKITSGLKRFLDLNPGLKLHNHYGSTEMHVVTSYTLDASTAAKTPIPPAGKPISNVKIYILDEHRNPVPIGVWGELYVAGNSELLGYINNSALTNEKLLYHTELSADNDNNRLYRSGDIGRWTEDGNIELRGRKDFQAKIRGFRVEPGEIESKILSVEHVRECVVVIKDDQHGNKGLFAYMVVENLDAAKVKEIVGRHLPQYMIPKFIILDKLPLMPNGKVDREKLPDPNAPGPIKKEAVSDLLQDGEYIRDVLTGTRTITDNTPIEELIAYYAALFRQSLPAGSLNISGIECNILAGEELTRMMKAETHGNEGPEQIIMQVFESQVKKTPGNIAIADASGTVKFAPHQSQSITYRELNEKSNCLAYQLKRKGVTAGTIVGIMDEPSQAMILGILGILKAGGAYLLIEPGTPQNQVISRLKENQVSLLLSSSQVVNNYSYTAFQDLASGFPSAAPGKPGEQSLQILLLDRLEEIIKDESSKSLKPFSQASDPAQVVYIPTCEKDKEEKNKITMTHREILHLLSHISGNQPPAVSFLFDFQPHQVFGPLLQGGTLYIPPQHSKTSNIQLLEFYNNNELPGSPEAVIDIDIRLLLKKHAHSSLLIDEAYAAPTDEIQLKLVEIWAEVLGIKQTQISIDSNFFEIGGHSLKATLVVSKIHKKLNKKIPLVEMFRNPTIRELSGYMKSVEEHEYVSIKPVEKREWYLPSSAQKRLYILHHMKKEDNLTYNMPQVVILKGRLDKHKLEETFRELIHRHEGLRTSFEMVDDEPVQEIHDFRETTFDIQQLIAKTGKSAPEYLIHNFVRPFDLSLAPLLRVGLIKVKEKKHVLMVDMHHIISDGTSIKVIIEEFMAFYAYQQLPALRLQYKDYSLWQKSEPQREAIKQQEEYWMEQFEQGIPVLDLPTDFPRPLVQSFEGSLVSFALGSEDTCSLKEFALNEGVTLYMVLLAIYNILLSKLSRQEEIVVGTPTAGRRHVDLQQIIGMFVNTLALKNQTAGGKTFKEFVKELGEKTLKTFNNQDYQYEELVEQVEVNRDASRNPLFDVMFTLQNIDIPEINIAGLELKPYNKRKHRTSKFDLNLVGVERDGNLFFTFEYCTKLFKEGTIERFAIYFKKIVNTIIEDSGIKISEIEIITGPEKERVLYEFNRTRIAYPKEKTIHRLFEEQVEKTPDKLAVVFEEKKLTYRVLDERAIQLAIQLRERGVKADTIVGIMVEWSLEMLLGVIGILKAGGGYLPIDVEYPEERKTYMLEDSRPVVLLTQAKHNRQMMSAVKVVDIFKDDIFKGNRDNFKLEGINNPGDLAYVIYTSGSTGRPKSVMVNHRNVVRLVKNTNFIKFEENDRLLQTGALEFDASTFEIWGSLLNGLTLYIVSKDNILSAGKLEQVIRKYKINTMWMTSPLFNQVSRVNLKIFASLRNLLVGGDVLSPSYINPVKRNYRELNIINGYGPTENTTFSTTFLITKEYERSIPIGKPIANSTAYIVDQSTKLLPVGVVGQLCVGGDGLARGYLNNTELTKEKFIDNSIVPGKTLYQTGDLARWLPDGNIEFIGRVDQQVKIRGFRVELGEIESRLLNIEEVKEVLVTVIEKSTGAGHWKEKSFCAYFVSEKEFAISELRNILSRSLPDYMIPAYFMKIEKMPLTPNGKIDRSALPAPEVETGARYTAPRDKTEEKLVEIWSDLLGVDKSSIGIDADFFRLGGHSLTATVLLARIHRELNVQIQLVEIFSLPTIRELGELLKLETKKILTSIEPAEEKEYYVLSSAQKRLYIQQQMDPHSIAYNVPEMIEIEGKLQKERVEKAIGKLINRHESLRTSFETIEVEAVQRVNDEIEFAIKYYETKDEKARTLAADFIKPFDLSKAPLLRVGLATLGEIKYLLMIDLHHIIFDGISRTLLIQDFFMLYSGQELPTLKLRYRDYSEWQNSPTQKKAVKQQEKYWLKQFEGKIPLLNLPTNTDRLKMKSYEGKSINFEIDEGKSNALREWALEEGVTLFMLLIATYYVLLSKLTGQEDIVVGTGVMGRRHPDLEPIIGMHVNMLALRNYPQGEKRFSDFLKEVKETTLNALENQDYQYENLVEQIPRDRNTAGNSLFNVAFSIQTIEPNIEKISNLKFKPFRHENRISKFDMTMVVLDKGGKLFFNVEYNTEILKQETIEIYIKYFKEIMVTVMENKDCRLEDIKVVHHLSAPGLKLLQEEEGDFGF